VHSKGVIRIIAGEYRGRRINVPSRPGLRPTPDRVRETLFNWLGQWLDGQTCLDLFAGSGALGFEAASRGAAEVVLLERDPALVALLSASKARLGAEALRIERSDALQWMARAAPGAFELVLLDPPFDSPLVLPALAAAARIVVPGGFVYVEAPQAGAAEPAAAAGLEPWRASRAGNVHFHLVRRPGAG
jgi:16S rRNA (guanine966-N2)-methyltransferase